MIPFSAQLFSQICCYRPYFNCKWYNNICVKSQRLLYDTVLKWRKGFHVLRHNQNTYRPAEIDFKSIYLVSSMERIKRPGSWLELYVAGDDFFRILCLWQPFISAFLHFTLKKKLLKERSSSLRSVLKLSWYPRASNLYNIVIFPAAVFVSFKRLPGFP
jgi:hypothetical protein